MRFSNRSGSGCRNSNVAMSSVSRREQITSSALMAGFWLLGGNEAARAAAQVGDCTDCIGEVNGTLNACSLSTDSCVSTLNDDELHFLAPWEYDGPMEDAIDRLISIATGGEYSPNLLQTPFGVSQAEVAGYIVKGVAAVIQNGEMPETPRRKRMESYVPFKGELVDRHTSTANGSEYVRLALYPSSSSSDDQGDGEVDPVEIIDAEFLFLAGDSIVNVRGVSREQPESGLLKGKGELVLSFTQGLVVDKNLARRRLESLRKAIGWQLAPVMTDFDPKFNPEVPEIVERVFQPFSERNSFQPSGESYPYEE